MGFVLCNGIASFWPLLILSCTLGERTEPVYELIGKEVQLDPKVTETIGSITWKKGGGAKVAEWDKNLGHDYYGRCLTAEQCELIATSGVLVLRGLKREDAGDYFPEINGEAAKDTFPLAVLEPVSKPSVDKSCSETQCILTCVGQQSQYTRYSWKENNKTVEEVNILTVQKTGDQSKSYTCVFSNPKSEEHSDPLTEMDLFPLKGLPVGSIVGGFIGGVLAVLLAAGAAIFYRRKMKGGQNEGNPSAPAGNNAEDNYSMISCPFT